MLRISSSPLYASNFVYVFRLFFFCPLFIPRGVPTSNIKSVIGSINNKKSVAHLDLKQLKSSNANLNHIEQYQVVAI